MAETKTPPSLRSVFTDAVILALSSVAAYACAFAFEAGVADCYGAPRWLIDISLSNALLAWGALVVLVGSTAMGAITIGAMIPARPLRVLLWSWLTYELILAGWFLLLAQGLLWSFESVWPGVAALLMAGFYLAAVILIWLGHYRATDPQLKFIDRVEAAHARAREQSDPRPVVRGNIVSRIVDSTTWGGTFVRTYSLLVLFLGLLGSFYYVGRAQAADPTAGMISNDSMPLAALRGYGGVLLARGLAPVDSPAGRPVQFVDVSSSTRLWRPVDGRDRRTVFACIE